MRSATTLLLVGLLLVVQAGAVQSADLSEAARWLQQYLRVDTSNPPGNEGPAAALLASILHREGIATRTFFSPGGRPTLLARLEAERPVGGALILLHHLDVVPPGGGWSQPPFGGERADGKIWGRGAIDSKSLGIAHLAALVDLERSGAELSRDVIFLAAADEERGGTEGIGWLLEAHSAVLGDIAAVLTEGGANRVIQDRLHWWGIEVAQKRPLWLRVRTRGRGGHASDYNPASATHRLLQALARVTELEAPLRITEASHHYLRHAAPMYGARFREVFDQPTVAATQAGLDALVAERRLHEVKLPSLALLQDTVQVTTFDNGNSSVNAAPQEATATLDVRLLPDTDEEAFLSRLREVLGDAVELEVILPAPAPTLPVLDHPIYRTVAQQLSPTAPVVPSFITGTTDARYFRERGVAAFGFSPFRLSSEQARGVHAANESLPLSELDAGVRLTLEVVRACATRPPVEGAGESP